MGFTASGLPEEKRGMGGWERDPFVAVSRFFKRVFTTQHKAQKSSVTLYWPYRYNNKIQEYTVYCSRLTLHRQPMSSRLPVYGADPTAEDQYPPAGSSSLWLSLKGLH